MVINYMFAAIMETKFFNMGTHFNCFFIVSAPNFLKLYFRYDAWINLHSLSTKTSFYMNVNFVV
jgi:hypothetical protein